MGFSSPRFTWNKGNLFQRLDRVLCNTRWDDIALNYFVRHLHRLKLDHRLLLVVPSNAPHNSDSSWLIHLEFKDLKRNLTIASNLEQFKSVVQFYNKKVYGNIFAMKKELIMELKRVQRILEFRQSTCLKVRKAELQREINDLLKHDENVWFQKSHAERLTNGDRNTKYFHRCMIARRKLNRVDRLIVGDGGWCFDYEILQHVDFFQELYTAGTRVIRNFPCWGIFFTISEYDR
ncbi:hypothetical protein CXB51_028358 [Gossypium anomalum]|uniref:Uncharacterized protein n=1 Tax=Gossypium anomalum TaxID=47600 RepID=A0A8J6CPH2_9ROSI|nr:hypothetical protein CXB51_028358 [Gossypium anomalum]